eukprot:scaffold27463_cov32-Attheya_sp.AAC.2
MSWIVILVVLGVPVVLIILSLSRGCLDAHGGTGSWWSSMVLVETTSRPRADHEQITSRLDHELHFVFDSSHNLIRFRQ